MRVKENILEQVKAQSQGKSCNAFIDELVTIYESEQRLNLTLPQMILDAKTPEIAAGLTVHLKFTQDHLLRLETFFTSIKKSIKT